VSALEYDEAKRKKNSSVNAINFGLFACFSDHIKNDN
jgi:hypothetical protein